MAADLRPVVRNLVVRLASARGDAAHRVITDAYLVLEQSQRLSSLHHGGGLEAALPPGRPRDGSAVAGEYREVLPNCLLGLHLTGAEEGALVDALVGRLDGDDPQIVAGAAGALGPSARLDLVPRLSTLVRQYAASDALITTNAINSIRKILQVVDTNAPRSASHTAIIRDAFLALRHAADNGTPDRTLDVRGTAATELSILALRFGAMVPEQGSR
jgi:hypothetical protein